MVILVMCLLVLMAVCLVFVRRSRETGMICVIMLLLALHWTTVLIYISKKGGISADMQVLLFCTKSIRLKFQYLLVTLQQLGFAMALGRYLFPLFSLCLALYYTYDRRIRSSGKWYWIIAVLPLASIVIYWPNVFEALTSRQPKLLEVIVKFSLGWIIAYLVIAIVLFVHEYRHITMGFAKRQYRQKMAMIISVMILYALYCPQDPAQVYLFYRNDYMGASQGLWYLSPALSLSNYLLVIVIVVICSLVGFRSLLICTQDYWQEEQENITIARKFDMASKGVNVFVHSVKNQLLANRVLIKRMDNELNKPQADVAKLQEYQKGLFEANEAMLVRLDELYQGVRTNRISLVPCNLYVICTAAQERLLRKYPEALLSIDVPQNIEILCDKPHLTEALYNLLANGWEAQMMAQKIQFAMEIQCTQERLWTVLAIRDHGNGMTAFERKQIYDPFYSSKNSNYNWGMGLYYVRQIAKSHLGSLRVDSTVGQGSTFYLQLPRYESNH